MVVGESTDLLSAFPPNSTPRWHYPWALLNVDVVIVVPAMWRGARQSAGQRVPPGRLPRPLPTAPRRLPQYGAQEAFQRRPLIVVPWAYRPTPFTFWCEAHRMGQDPKTNQI
jgi:hypothetical protein